MNSPRTSVLVFGIYVFLLGVLIMTMPNQVLQFFGLEPTNEVWIRIAGVLLLSISYYYMQAARFDLKQFYMTTTQTRTIMFIFFLAFVLFDYISPALLIFGAVNLLGAAWTFFALRSQGS